jgi:hypothetical protein
MKIRNDSAISLEINFKAKRQSRLKPAKIQLIQSIFFQSAKEQNQNNLCKLMMRNQVSSRNLVYKNTSYFMTVPKADFSF